MNNDTGVYAITSPSGKQYIGSAMSFRKRWNEHRNQLRLGKHHNASLQKAFEKYGEESLIFSKIALCTVTDLLILEQRYIDRLQPAYNICKVAGSRLGTKQSAETLAKVSAALRGRTMSAEAIEKRAAACRGQIRGPLSDSVRKKLSEALKGNKNNEGRAPASAETRAKLSAAGLGVARPKSAEHRAKISKTLTGRPLSPETRAKLSEMRKGKPKSPEHVAKVAAAVSATKQRKRAERLAMEMLNQGPQNVLFPE